MWPKVALSDQLGQLPHALDVCIWPLAGCNAPQQDPKRVDIRGVGVWESGQVGGVSLGMWWWWCMVLIRTCSLRYLPGGSLNHYLRCLLCVTVEGVSA